MELAENQDKNVLHTLRKQHRIHCTLELSHIQGKRPQKSLPAEMERMPSLTLEGTSGHHHEKAALAPAFQPASPEASGWWPYLSF